MDFLNQIWIAIEPTVINAVVQVLSIALPLLAGAATVWIVQKIRLLQTQIKAANPTEYEMVMNYAKDAVKFAEQAKIGGIIDAQGRKEAAIEYVQKWVDAKGIKVDASQIASAVELAVFTELKKEGIIPSENQ